MSIFDDIERIRKEKGGEGFKRKILFPDGSVMEELVIGWDEIPLNAPKLTPERRKEEKEDKVQKYEFLPPKEQFVFDLRYLLDLAKASKEERSVVEKLIKRFESGDKQSKTTRKGASQA